MLFLKYLPEIEHCLGNKPGKPKTELKSRHIKNNCMANLFVSTRGITKAQLIAVMIFQLSNFNRTGSVVDENTVHKDILSEDDGTTSSTSSKNLYKGLVRFTIVANGHEDKKWPNKWMDQTVKDLADGIF